MHLLFWFGFISIIIALAFLIVSIVNEWRNPNPVDRTNIIIYNFISLFFVVVAIILFLFYYTTEGGKSKTTINHAAIPTTAYQISTRPGCIQPGFGLGI